MVQFILIATIICLTAFITEKKIKKRYSIQKKYHPRFINEMHVVGVIIVIWITIIFSIFFGYHKIIGMLIVMAIFTTDILFELRYRREAKYYMPIIIWVIALALIIALFCIIFES